jgi:hypothetical protein
MPSSSQQIKKEKSETKHKKAKWGKRRRAQQNSGDEMNQIQDDNG